MNAIINWFTKPHVAALVTFAAALGAFLHATGVIPADDVTTIVTAWASLLTGATAIGKVVDAFVDALKGSDT